MTSTNSFLAAIFPRCAMCGFLFYWLTLKSPKTVKMRHPFALSSLKSNFKMGLKGIKNEHRFEKASHKQTTLLSFIIHSLIHI